MRARCVSTHHCLCPGLCGGCAGGRRRRSSSPAVCAWRRRPAWGRCSEAADGTRAEPSPSPPAHRLRPSWSACRPGRRAAEGDACQSDGPVAVATDGERGQRTAAACPRSSPDEMLTTQQIQFNLSRKPNDPSDRNEADRLKTAALITSWALRAFEDEEKVSRGDDSEDPKHLQCLLKKRSPLLSGGKVNSSKVSATTPHLSPKLTFRVGRALVNDGPGAPCQRTT